MVVAEIERAVGDADGRGWINDRAEAARRAGAAGRGQADQDRRLLHGVGVRCRQVEGVGVVRVGHDVIDGAARQPADRRIAACVVDDRLSPLETVGIAQINAVVSARNGRGRRECPADRVLIPGCAGGIERQPQAVVRAGAGRARGERDRLVAISGFQLHAPVVHLGHVVGAAIEEAA